MLFGAISGSAAASASAIGSIMGPEMKKEGYSENFSAAVNISSATTGLSIPPSNILIVYSLASGGASITALFLAGYIPGILTGVSIMLMAMSMMVYRIKGMKGMVSSLLRFTAGLAVIVGLIAGLQVAGGSSKTLLNLFLMLLALAIAFYVRYRYRRNPQGGKRAFKTLWDAIPSLFLLIIVIGGIVAGFFTATEASAVAVLYAFILAILYKKMTIKDMPQIILRSVKTTAIVLLLVATCIGLSWIMAYENIPQTVSEGLLGISNRPVIILLLINLILLFVGVFMDMTPAVLIFTPIFLPIVVELGIDPVHFGIVMVLNLSVGLCTPPVGSVLFIGCSVANVKIDRVIKPLLPMFIAMIVCLLLVTYIPQLSLWVPELFGF
jgi:TRAP-type C4-dicarboxylate transport system permease large subunit